MNNCPWCGAPSEHSFLTLNDYFLSQESFEIFECDQCHLLFTVPRPSPELIGQYYKSDNYYSHQENKHGFIPRVYEFVKSFNMKRKVQLATDGLPVGTMLDIGCGVGDFLSAMAEKSWKITGIEPSDDARALAQKKLGITLLKPQESSTLPDHSFDLITLWHVLEHVDDLHFQLSEIKRLLKPNGRLLLALPNFKSFDAQYYKEHWAAWDVPRHLNHFCPDSIRSIVCQSFELVDIQKLVWDSYYISYLSETYCSHSLPLVRGAFVGLKSNIKAHRTGMYSSLVYRFKNS